MIVTSIVIIVVLAIMLLFVDMTALHLLRMMKLVSFLFADHTISLGLHLHILYALLAIFQAHGLFLGQAA